MIFRLSTRFRKDSGNVYDPFRHSSAENDTLLLLIKYLPDFVRTPPLYLLIAEPVNKCFLLIMILICLVRIIYIIRLFSV